MACLRYDLCGGAGPLEAKVVIEPIELDLAPGALLELLDQRRDPVMLESSARHETFGRHTVIACCPLDVLTLRDKTLTDASGRVLAEDNKTFWSVLKDAFSAVELQGAAPAAGYMPGWIGYVGYEVGRCIERLPGSAVDDTHLPDLRLAFYDAVLVYNVIEQSWCLARLEFDCPPPGAGSGAEALGEIVSLARSATDESPPGSVEQADAGVRAAVGDAVSNFTADEYRAAVRKCVDYIAAGDVFEVCLTQRFVLAGARSPLAIYKALRRRNPAWYAAYLSFEAGGARCSVLSSSPELFLRVRGRHVITRPIKGTRPRVGVVETDRAAAAQLRASAKDNAELAMIVDLLRNDLGRRCRYGTVKVTDPCRLETHPTVFHLVATVEGDLCEGVGPAELLRATFPGGSITGAPKIRAMEIIDELEGIARGVYTGCIGHVGVDGSCEWNIAIRTIICDDERTFVQVGGAVVADSNDDDEYDETLAKARAMLEAIAEADSWDPPPPDQPRVTDFPGRT